MRYMLKPKVHAAWLDPEVSFCGFAGFRSLSSRRLEMAMLGYEL